MPPSLTESLDQLYSTTWQLMRNEAVDNIFKATPLSYRLYTKGVRKESGGRWIGVQLLYGKNTSVETIGIGGAVNIINDDIITTGKADWKWCVANIVRYFGEDTQNAGKSQIMSLMQAKLKVAELSMVDKFEAMLVADGSGNGGLDFSGLGNYIRKDPTTSTAVMGVNQSTYSWWQNQKFDLAQGGSPTHAGTMKLIRGGYNTCSVGNDHPTLLLSTQDVYEWYELQLTNILRTMDTTMGDIGFEALRYKGAAWTYSPSVVAGIPPFDTSDHGIFFINERYLDLVIHSEADFAMTEWKPIPNQLDRVAQIVVQGELVCSNRRMQGVGFGLASIPTS